MNNTKTNTPSGELKVSKGVYKTPSGTYRVRPVINGKRKSITFTNKSKAIAYYKSL